MKELQDLYKKYRRAMVRITIRNTEGDPECGSGFHIGGGYLVTAKHVVDGHEVTEIVAGPHVPDHPVALKCVLPSSEPDVDLALLETDFFERPNLGYGETDVVPIGGHLDDWINDDFVLTSAVLMGFPRVPAWADMGLVAVTGQVNSVIDRYDRRFVHFIISTMARGGFSGGPVISEHGFLLGVATESLLADGKTTETGYTAAVSVEPLWNLLLEHRVLPKGENGEFMRELVGSSMADWTPEQKRLLPDDPMPVIKLLRHANGQVFAELRPPYGSKETDFPDLPI